MNKNKLGLVKHLLKSGKIQGESWNDLAIRYGFSNGEEARSCWKNYRKNHFDQEETKLTSDLEEFESLIELEKGEGKVKWISSKEVLTEAEIYKECKMDSNKWLLVNIWHKKRGNGFVYSANFKLKFGNHIDNVKTNIESIIKNYKSKYNPIKKEDLLLNSKFVDPCAVYISLTDSHLDRLTTHGRSIDDATTQYLDTIEFLITKAWCCNLVEEVVYVIGNDLFNSDTFFSETTAGTQQHDNVMYDESYEKIFDMQVKAINKLKQFCTKLNVKFVPGNHDRTKGFYLVHALEVYFKSDKNIVFDRGADNTKVYVYGENFIGMHHGDTKPEDLPLYFASKYYKQWGTAKYKEIGIGDKHVKKSWQLRIKPTEDEMNGVRVFMTPSLCDNSLWEKNGLLDTGIACGICRIYSKKEGKVGEFEKRINLK